MPQYPNPNRGAQSIKLWMEDERPREKLLNQGRTALNNAELLAILIRSGSPSLSAVDLSRVVLEKVDNNLNELGKAGVDELTAIKGIGTAKALTILAALELGRRRHGTEARKRARITSSLDAYEQIYPILADLNHEQFWVLYLNRQNAIIHKEMISSGGVSGTVVDAKMVFHNAMKHLASAMILVHNHPSGNLDASQADIQLTRKLRDAGQLLDVAVLDHLIIGDKGYTSMADEGLI